MMGESHTREAINNDVTNLYMIVGDLSHNYSATRIECENLVHFLGKIDGLLRCDLQTGRIGTKKNGGMLAHLSGFHHHVGESAATKESVFVCVCVDEVGLMDPLQR